MTQIVKYQDDIQALLDDQRAVWLTADQIAALLDVTRQNVYQHINNFKKITALQQVENSVKNFLTNPDDARTATEHYSVDVLIYIAYRMNRQETNDRVQQFRQWVAGIVDRYLRGDLRTAERHTFDGVKDLLAYTSVDYDKSSPEAALYFATIQNKLLYAATGHTAAELIAGRANHHQPNMGLQTWKGGNITLGDATVGKNYLTSDELKKLQNLVSVLYLVAPNYQRTGATMRDWLDYIDNQIIVARMNVLIGHGTVSRQTAEAIARREYTAFKQQLQAVN